MKNLILLLIVLAAFKPAQARPTNYPQAIQRDTIPTGRDTAMKDYVSMQGGQMILVQHEKAGRMKTDMKMKNGTVVKASGEVTTADGHSFQLKEGDRIYLNGRIEGPSKSPI